jgi:hypothetical protein
MEEEQIQVNPQKPVKRPQLLTMLCILTFVFSGMGVVGFLMVFANYEESMEALRLIYGDMEEATYILNAPREFFFISLVLSAFSLFGALLMWRLRKAGFHFYTSAQIITLLLPFIYFGSETNPLLNILVTAFFVYLYSRNLKFMH